MLTSLSQSIMLFCFYLAKTKTKKNGVSDSYCVIYTTHLPTIYESDNLASLLPTFRRFFRENISFSNFTFILLSLNLICELHS